MVGGGRAPVPGRPTTRQQAPPPGTLMPPQQRAKPARKGVRCGVGDGSPRPHPPHPQPVGSGPRPHARKDEWSVVGERPTPDAPHPGRRRPPWAPSCRPYSAPSQRARPARKSARVGVGEGSPRPHPPNGERAAPSQVGGNGTPPPPQTSQTEHGTEAGHAEGHGPSGTALPAPSTGTARGARATLTRGGGGGGGCRESASEHTHKGHAGTTRRATGPSPRNAQTAWNGVPASEDKGHPEGTARHTQRRKRWAGRGKQRRHNTRHRPQPRRTSRERRTHTTRALHPP